MGPGAQSLLREFFPPEKLGFAFSVFSLSSSIGAGLAFAIGGLAGTLIDPSAVHEVLVAVVTEVLGGPAMVGMRC